MVSALSLKISWHFIFFSVGGEQVAWHKLLLSAFSVVASIWKSFPCNQTTSFYVFILSHTDRNCCVLDFSDAKYLHCSVEQVTVWSIYKTFQYHSYLRLKTRSLFTQMCVQIVVSTELVSVLGEKSKCQVLRWVRGLNNLLHRFYNNLW